MAATFRPNPIYIKSIQVALSFGEELIYGNWDGAHVKSTVMCASRAYEEAGIKNPRKEISMMDVHDCLSITELVTYEDLGISERGKAGNDVRDGVFNLDGRIPCQPDGGLKCFGHPIGASGLRMMYEMYKQLQGKAGERQVKNPQIGLTHNMGGFPSLSMVSLSIVGHKKG
jgi:acetyl-CoA C-acetyltransferase